MNDQTENPEHVRLNQMEIDSAQGNFEYRLRRLEDERLPHRVTSLEFSVANIQGEVVAVKEIARGIGTKLDSGLDRLQMESARNQAFIKGVLWVGGGMVTLVAMAPLAGQLLKKLLGV